MTGECHWIAVDVNPTRWAQDISKPPPACEWPQQCIEPEHEAAEIGETFTNECREDPAAQT